MKFNHIVKHNGVFYAAGEDVPCDYATTDESMEELVNKTPPVLPELESMTIREIMELAKAQGITIESTKKADIIAELKARSN